ncbi:MAG TPA: biotin/lipoyl-containing protein [Blastocatellia bacterium]|jgi:biotin carboxyl carrier protein|nr:biotin/lipoyl-containing protein [Blastocatellia bacterium]
MKYEAEIDGLRVSMNIDAREGRIDAVIDGRSYLLEVSQPEPGSYLFFLGNKVYEARVWEEGPASLRVKLRDRLFRAKLIDRKQRKATAEQGEEGRQYLTAPMPGKVVKVLRGVGDEVAAGGGVVVVEAMKMQNEVRSRKAGRVVELRVSEGATVKAGEVLAVVE